MLDFRNYKKQDIEEKLRKARFRPLDVMVTGVTGAGKSTTLNTIFSKNVATIGNGVDPETMNLDSYLLNDIFRLWDTPGLGDNVQIDEVHKKKLVDLLYKTYSLDGNTYGWVDLAVVVIEGANRDMGSTYILLNEVIVPNIQSDRVLVVINQADVAMKGKHWNKTKSKPDKILENFLEKQALSIQKRVEEATGITIKKPIYYSAEYCYNIEKLLDFIIDNMPLERRKLMRH